MKNPKRGKLIFYTHKKPIQNSSNIFYKNQTNQKIFLTNQNQLFYMQQIIRLHFINQTTILLTAAKRSRMQ